MGIIGDIGSALIGKDAAKDAANTQVQMGNQQIDFMKDMYDKQQGLLKPYQQFGQGLLGQLGETMQPIDRQAELSAYYNSPEYAMQAGQARNQQLAASEAMGGLGSTATGNTLAAIAPQLGQNFLQQQYAQQMDQYNKLMGGVNLGQASAAGQANAAGALGTNVSNIMGGIGAAQAGGQLAQAQGMQQAIGSVNAGLNNAASMFLKGGF